MSVLISAVKRVGYLNIAHECTKQGFKLSGRAVHKWCRQGHLPRTEFSGETRYAEIIEQLSNGEFTKCLLLDETRTKLHSKAAK